MTMQSNPVVPRDFDAFSRWFQRVFQEFGANVGTWLLQGLLYMLVSLAAVAVPVALMLVASPGLWSTFVSSMSQENPSPGTIFQFLGAIIGVVVVVSIVAWVVSSYCPAPGFSWTQN